MQKKYNIIHVCEFLGMQSLRIGLILVLEGVVFHYIWLKYLFGTVTIYSNILFWTFLFKNTKLSIKKKKKKKKITQLMALQVQQLVFLFPLLF